MAAGPGKQPTAGRIIAALSLPRAHPEPRQDSPFPITKLQQLPRDGTMLYGIGRIDASGRVASREITAALGWQPGDRVDITVIPSAIIIRRSPDGAVSIPRKPCIIIPATARHQRAISAGDSVLLAAAPAHGIVIIYTMRALDDMVSGYHATPAPHRAP